MVAIGVRAAPMVALTACSVGVTLAMQAAHSLATRRGNLRAGSRDGHVAPRDGSGLDRGDRDRPERFGRRGGDWAQ